MKANLPVREPEILAFWEEAGIPAAVRERVAGRPKFLLHDGPPYANGDIHLGTALNKVLKDIINKFYSQMGYDTPYVPGWDTHGLPIEHRALQHLGLDRHHTDPLEVRGVCADFARKYIGLMTEQFKRLGIRGDWEHPYITMDPAYEAAEVVVFGEMYQKGYIYKGLRPVYWCPSCETALAEAEIEYATVRTDSVFVAFPVADGHGLLPDGVVALAWTTTPWTLPANQAVAVHPDLEYTLWQTESGTLLLATDRSEAVLALLGLKGTAVTRFKGRELEGLLLDHPFLSRQVPLVLSGHVTAEDGTGLVHIAPGHGEEDFEVGQRYGLTVEVPIDERGIFTAEAGFLAGLGHTEANAEILRVLRERGRLLKVHPIEHEYAHCWRCRNPIVYRATEQWFGSVAGFREGLLKAVDQVQWLPSWGQLRMHRMVADRGDWCISRQRVWGLPIPAFYCEDCQKPLVTENSIAAVADLFRREGSDAWYRREPDEILPAGTACPACGGIHFRKETDILDVWFDSGSSHAAVLSQRPELGWPADLYLEGSDQFRGWFNSSLSTAVATVGRAPYRTVLSHGFVVDGDGRKMSKSLGNVITAAEVVEKYGADILRLWAASADYRSDIRLSGDILSQVGEGYRKIRNTLRFILGNLAGFEPSQVELRPIDRYMLHRFSEVVAKVWEHYRSFDFHLVYHGIHNFMVSDLSAFYLDIQKDNLYTSHPRDPKRLAAQEVLYQLGSGLTRLLSPILTFTAEETWRHLPDLAGRSQSVQLSDFPRPEEYPQDAELLAEWNELRRVREFVVLELETARRQKEIGTSLEARIVLEVGGPLGELLQKYQAQLPEIFIVSAVTLLSGGAGEPVVRVERAAGEKCPRCWVYSEEIGREPEQPELCPRCAGVVANLERGAS